MKPAWQSGSGVKRAQEGPAGFQKAWEGESIEAAGGGRLGGSGEWLLLSSAGGLGKLSGQGAGLRPGGGREYKGPIVLGELSRGPRQSGVSKGACVYVGGAGQETHGSKGSKSSWLANKAPSTPGGASGLLAVEVSAQLENYGNLSLFYASKHSLHLWWPPVLPKPFHPEGSLGRGCRGQGQQG